MAVRRIHNDDIDSRLGEQFDALFSTCTNTDSSPSTQAPRCILSSIRVFSGLEDIFDGNQTTKLEVVIYDQYAFDAMLMHERLGVFDTATFANGD